MSLINRVFSISKHFSALINTSNILLARQIKNLPLLSTSSIRSIQTTPICNDLNEFFDDKKNWGENEVKHGRSWLKDELRIKSNTDLHKIWFVLLKEKNMLLTMEHEADEKGHLFPSPERLDNVKESMSNLEEVVRERNRAYHELETGMNGERPIRRVPNQLGIRFNYREFEHVVPQFMNKKWRENHKFQYGGSAVKKFLLMYREQLYNVKRKAQNRRRNEVAHLLRRNPNLDRNLLAERYPGVDIKKLADKDMIRGHFAPKI